MKKIYVICNSHMDPIWLWRLREGRSTWLNTCRTTVRMLEKYPFLKFTRSSSICYRWIEECDKTLFRKIVRLVDAGRWELVGGWVEQSDTIITPGESLLRQAEHGKKYFMEKFGRDVRIAYSVDSFGQNAGLPQILRTSGFDAYCYMRPMAHEKAMPDSFRWQSTPGSGEILSFRIRNAYCTVPGLAPDAFSKWFEHSIAADRHSLPVFFFGIGDHGGGIYEEQLKKLLALQDQYELEFCTLEHYFKQLKKCDLPVVSGELTHHSPGCYSAVGDVKEWMADCEKTLHKAEKLSLQLQDKKEAKLLYDAWDKLLFNYFHDVYSGTCIGDAYKHEIRDLCGAVNHTAERSMERSLSRIGSSIPSEFLTEGGVLLWNSNAFPARCLSCFDTFGDPNRTGKDFNCLKTADNRIIPLQGIHAASKFGPGGVSWKRMVVLDALNASEAKVYAYARTDRKFPLVGFKTQNVLLKKLRFAVLADVGDTWGHGVKRLGETLGYLEETGREEMENGPVVSQLRVHYRWKNSVLQLDLFQYSGFTPIQAVVSANWNEPDDTVKAGLSMPKKIRETVSGQASAILHRAADDCEQPFLDFVSAGNGGFLAHALHGYDVTGNELRLTVLRPVVYAEHAPNIPYGGEGYADMGTVRREFWCFAGNDSGAGCARMAREILWHAEHLEITAAPGKKDWSIDRWEITPESVTTQSGRLLPDGSREFHLLNNSPEKVTAVIRCNGKVQKKLSLSGGELKIVKTR